MLGRNKVTVIEEEKLVSECRPTTTTTQGVKPRRDLGSNQSSLGEQALQMELHSWRKMETISETNR